MFPLVGNLAGQQILNDEVRAWAHPVPTTASLLAPASSAPSLTVVLPTWQESVTYNLASGSDGYMDCYMDAPMRLGGRSKRFGARSRQSMREVLNLSAWRQTWLEDGGHSVVTSLTYRNGYTER